MAQKTGIAQPGRLSGVAVCLATWRRFLRRDVRWTNSPSRLRTTESGEMGLLSRTRLATIYCFTWTMEDPWLCGESRRSDPVDHSEPNKRTALSSKNRHRLPAYRLAAVKPADDGKLHLTEIGVKMLEDRATLDSIATSRIDGL